MKHVSTFRVTKTIALAKYLEVAFESTILCKLTGRIDKDAASDEYWLQLFCTTSLPNDGPILPAQFLVAPIKITHTNGTDSVFDIDFSPDFIRSQNGLFLGVSTTEFSKTTILTNSLSCTAFTH